MNSKYSVGEVINVAAIEGTVMESGIPRYYICDDSTGDGVLCVPQRYESEYFTGRCDFNLKWWPYHCKKEEATKQIREDKMNVIKIKDIDASKYEDCQFIGSWEYHKKPWSNALRIQDGRLEIYDEDCDDFITKSQDNDNVLTLQHYVYGVLVPLDLRTKRHSITLHIDMERYEEACDEIVYQAKHGKNSLEELMDAVIVDHGALAMGEVCKHLFNKNILIIATLAKEEE